MTTRQEATIERLQTKCDRLERERNTALNERDDAVREFAELRSAVNRGAL